MVEPKAKRGYLKAHANSAYIRLNDLIIGTEIAVVALEDFATSVKESKEPLTLSLPSSKGKFREISRSDAELRAILAQQITFKEYQKTLNFSVMEAEDHIASYIRVVIRAYPDRL